MADGVTCASSHFKNIMFVSAVIGTVLVLGVGVGYVIGRYQASGKYNSDHIPCLLLF